MTRQKETFSNKKLKASSARWLMRQRRDPYVLKAKAEGLRARSFFKIQEIQEKYSFIRHGQSVLDLGAAPGGWTEYLVKLDLQLRVVAVDILEMSAIGGAKIIQGDIFDEAVQSSFGDSFDVILSDLAPSTTGHKTTDQLRSLALCEEVLLMSEKCLKPEGSLVMKIFQGQGTPALYQQMKKQFQKVMYVKPSASRSASCEIYLMGQGYQC
jgi:23S rRNA (uridine2552-2'-O)-methyltransferase